MTLRDVLKKRFETGKKPTGSDFAALIDNTGRNRETFVSTANQKVFYLSKSYSQFENQIDVIVGGSPQFSPDNFVETSPTSFTLNVELPVGVDVVVTYY